ncbi:membrane dipeptidase [Sphingosinicella sp. LHD-64]|uniref:dipeptidase n=1 Tax=Sphingosinicella sp. LHD-64 TaxID=3072139 RepID=UPI00280EBC49|nr:membrane dipeptidase [Sphingosinicella sp. LHD-64]MDQ8755887.1 membrane dipeptidase [Sphingosinicella sp. LHD-64]
MDRRSFLLAAGAAGATLAFPVAAQDAPARPRGARSIYVDAQGAPDGFDEPEPGRYVPNQRLIDAMRARRIDLISATVAPVGNGDHRFRESTEAIASWDRIIAANASLLHKIESAADIRAAHNAGKLAILYNFQDTVALEGDASRVDTFATLGVKQIQLTYNKRNLAGDGCLEGANAGLSDFGREVIARINTAKVLLDLSHAGQRTQAEGIAASSAPPAITHSGCRALADLPRNTHDAEMRALAGKGGVFGVYLMPFLRTSGQPGTEDLLRHVEHAVNVCGEDHVGIGTDNPFLGYEINDETRAQQRRFFEDRQRRGIAAPGEAADVLNLVEGYNSADRYDRIGADLRRRGWSTARVEKVLGGNFVRLFGEVWGG